MPRVAAVSVLVTRAIVGRACVWPNPWSKWPQKLLPPRLDKRQCRMKISRPGVKKVFAILQQLQALEAGMLGASEGEVAGKLTPQDSIQRNRVICLECHKEFKLLSNRHLALHGINSREYKLKYGLPLRQALSAKSLTLARRKIAKEKGLGEKLVAHRRKQT